MKYIKLFLYVLRTSFIFIFGTVITILIAVAPFIAVTEKVNTNSVAGILLLLASAGWSIAVVIFVILLLCEDVDFRV